MIASPANKPVQTAQKVTKVEAVIELPPMMSDFWMPARKLAGSMLARRLPKPLILGRSILSLNGRASSDRPPAATCWRNVWMRTSVRLTRGLTRLATNMVTAAKTTKAMNSANI